MRHTFEVLYSLILRNIKVRYRQSLIGIGWSLIQPVSLMIVYTLIFSHFLHLSYGSTPYPVFIFAALLPWTFFASALTRGSMAAVSDEALIKKLPIPVEYYPVSMVISCLADFIIALLVFIVLLFHYHLPLSPFMLFSIPLLLLCTLFSIGICLFTSSVNAYYRDIQHAIPLLIQIWFFATPIIYSYSQIPASYRFLYYLNPMSPIVESFRRILVYAQPPDYYGLLYACAITALVCIFSYSASRRLAPKLVDYV